MNGAAFVEEGRRAAIAELLGGLPTSSQRTLRATVELAVELGTPVAWVGGGVRDLLMGRAHPDFDLVVAGDPTPLGRALQGRLGGELRSHPRFATSTLEHAGGRIDLARARRERYPEPGALPEVEPASLEDDLGRRDFTVNAMALSLPDGSWQHARLLDPHRGQQDLALRCLRTLHPQSFVDDPTRIFRGIGFEVRLGFAFERDTWRSARRAVEQGGIEKLSGQRLRAAFLRAAPTPEAAPLALRRLDELGAGAHLSTDRPLSLDAAAHLAARIAAELPGSERGVAAPERLLLLALGSTADRGSRLALAARLALPRAEREALIDGPERVSAAASGLVPDALPHRAAELLESLDPVEVAAVAALGGPAAAGWAERWRERLRHQVVRVEARELIEAGVPAGPALGAALRAARRARLDRDADREEELATALAAARAFEESSS